MGRRRTTLVSLTRFQAELERLLKEALELSFDPPPRAGEWQPPLDVLEGDETVVVLVELPGVAPADVTVEIRGKTLRVAGRKRAGQRLAGHGSYHCMERQEGAFERAIELITPVNTHTARARFDHGVLVIECPKVVDRRERPREIPIEECDESGESGGGTPDRPPRDD